MSAPSSEIFIDLSTAILRSHDSCLQCRLVGDEGVDLHRLPRGPFMPHIHRTMETGLRQWVSEQVGVDLAHIEQLYTFADQGRHSGETDRHVVSVGYLALSRTHDAADGETAANNWGDIYDYFPWEDWRTDRPDMLDAIILPALDKWLKKNPNQIDRVRLAFGRDGAQWDEEFVLERYELLYQAALVAEAVHDGRVTQPATQRPLGTPLQLDHRRILATALGRLRGKLKYRPVIFDLMPPRFTLRALQATTELVMGANLHKQNFRRLVEKSGFLEPTGTMERARGRPAEIFRIRATQAAERPLAGLRVSAGRARPSKFSPK